uniref:Monocyte to macrophage differentiation associated n=1 Tax=Myotis myotis TaxID=51298 RepID=A0A7J7T6J9_MYOMY|nr:monocyte to macrophage differentiation associated [Myotis myotis]
MRFQNRFQRFMNHRAPANGRYKPTCYEHAANCYTHAFLIVPAIVGSALLHRLSDDCWEKITAWIYGMGLCALFIVSTVFMRWFIWLMAAGGTIYVFLYHEKYKLVELLFYLTMGFSPASRPHSTGKPTFALFPSGCSSACALVSVVGHLLKLPSGVTVHSGVASMVPDSVIVT